MKAWSIPNYITCIGMANQFRKRLQKNKSIVYGCCSNGHRFNFLQIDNESRIGVCFC